MADTITDGLKHDGGKLRLDLVPPELIEAVGAVRTYGIHKYKEEYSYRKVEPKRYRAALMRHVSKWLKNPHGIDEDSGLPHLWHIACNVAFLIELDGERTNEQLQVNSGSRQTYIENIDVAHIKSEAIREFAEEDNNAE